ncbi:MAG: DUF308 domain-containing protein [Bacillota bacterium]|nr:DUF308 domain-containing protein [Bacillota bacterium]
MRVITIVSGAIMVLSGIFCFMNTGQTFLAMAFIIGLVMVLNGVIHIIGHLMGRGVNNRGDNNGWILVDGMVTLMLGILVLANQLVADTSIHMVFGMWLLVSGVLRLEAASRINFKNKKKNFLITFITGLLTTLLGIFGFINPLVSFVSTIVLLGTFMLMQGINAVELGIDMPHEKKKYMKIYKKREAIKITDEDETPEAVYERLKQRDAQKEAEALLKTEVKVKIGADIDEKL